MIRIIRSWLQRRRNRKAIALLQSWMDEPGDDVLPLDVEPIQLRLSDDGQTG